MFLKYIMSAKWLLIIENILFFFDTILKWLWEQWYIMVLMMDDEFLSSIKNQLCV